MRERPKEPAVLTSWKEIARYIGKGVRTAQRWEQRYGLPVVRPEQGKNRLSVLARVDELDAWLKSSWARRARSEASAGFLRDGRFDTLQTALSQARNLQNQHRVLLGELRLSLKSLVLACRQIRKSRMQIENLILAGNRVHERGDKVNALSPPALNATREFESEPTTE